MKDLTCGLKEVQIGGGVLKLAQTVATGQEFGSCHLISRGRTIQSCFSVTTICLERYKV